MKKHCFYRFVMICTLLLSGWQAGAWAAPVVTPESAAVTPAPGTPERKAIMNALRATGMQGEGEWRTVFVVEYLKVADGWAWTHTLPQTANGMNKFEPVSALLEKKGGRWSVVAFRPCCGDCADDPDCADDRRYFKRLHEQFPEVPVEIFPVAVPLEAGRDGPSFDCAQAGTPDEQFICGSKRLRRADKRLAGLYRDLLDRLKGWHERQDVIEEQRVWLRRRRQACPQRAQHVGRIDNAWVEDCLMREYNRRIVKLHRELTILQNRRVFENAQARVPIPRGWQVRPSMSTNFRSEVIKEGKPVVREVVQRVADSIELTNGQFVITVAAGVRPMAGRFSDIARYMAADNLIIAEHPCGPCGRSTTHQISEELIRIDLYVDPAPPKTQDCCAYLPIQKSAWYGSYVTTRTHDDPMAGFFGDLEVFLTEHEGARRQELEFPRYFAVTLSTDTDNVYRLPPEGSKDLEDALSLMSQVAKNVCIFPERHSGSSKYCVVTGFDGKEDDLNDGRVAKMGSLTRLWEEGGRRYLEFDYMEEISQEDCRWLVQAGVDGERDCEHDGQISNTNPLLRIFEVSPGVEISQQAPRIVSGDLSWERLVQMWRDKSKPYYPLGPWRIVRRGNRVEHLELLYTP